MGDARAGAPDAHPGRAVGHAVRRGGLAAVGVLLTGFVVTAVLAVLAYSVNSHSEHHLLTLQNGQAAAVLRQAVSSVETPLMAGAEVAEASGGFTQRLRDYISRYVGPGKPFVAVSLWRVIGATATPLRTLAGAPPTAAPGQGAFVASAEHTNRLVVGTAGLSGAHPRLWYATTASTPHPRFALFAEAALPPHRHLVVPANSPFHELHFAVYLGGTTSRRMLLEADEPGVAFRGDVARAVVPFGTTSMTIVAIPAERLTGTLSNSLWWLVAIIGGVLSLLAALGVERLTRRRVTAEQLRGRVEQLLREQRSIAEQLQRSLLPSRLPTIEGVDIAARYVPGTTGTEIGGDWYDVVPLGTGRLFVVIGDVSGRGIPAAAVMASLRFAIRGFISEGHRPEVVLDAAARLIDLRTDRHFATALCAIVDLTDRRLTVASAGHLPPVLADRSAGPVGIEVCPPLGVGHDVEYSAVDIALPDSGTLLLFTDGLVERRGEDLRVGLTRLSRRVDELRARGAPPAPGATGVDGLLDDLVATMVPASATDDTALVGLAWS